jgi:hypothetical protein
MNGVQKPPYSCLFFKIKKDRIKMFSDSLNLPKGILLWKLKRF